MSGLPLTRKMSYNFAAPPSAPIGRQALLVQEGWSLSPPSSFGHQPTMHNAIAPSIVDTPLSDKFLNNEAKMERAVERHPLKKVGSPSELAKAAIFLLTNSSWITGQVIGVDGGIGNLKI